MILMEKMSVRKVRVGSVYLGGDLPVLIQSMTNTKTSDVKATLEQINHLAEVGCEIIRVAVPQEEDLKGFREIVKQAPLPVVADIHFNYLLAIKAVEAGAVKVRINPGNLGGLDKLLEVAKAAKGQAAIRVGVNAGSLPKNYLESINAGHLNLPEAMAYLAKDYVDFLYDHDFFDVVVSLKASDVLTTVSANRKFRTFSEAPLHLGITEAGTAFSGTVKSAVGMGTLLLEGIGETIRVSLTADPNNEIKVAQEILKACGLRRFGPTVISCPTCGRTKIDLYTLAKKVEKMVESIKEDLVIAVMGCAVNGPGEAKNADLGIAGGKGEGLIFVGGEVVEKVRESDLLTRFEFYLQKVLERRREN